MLLFKSTVKVNPGESIRIVAGRHDDWHQLVDITAHESQEGKTLVVSIEDAPAVRVFTDPEDMISELRRMVRAFNRGVHDDPSDGEEGQAPPSASRKETIAAAIKHVGLWEVSSRLTDPEDRRLLHEIIDEHKNSRETQTDSLLKAIGIKL